MSLLDRVERGQPAFVASLGSHGARLALLTDGTELTYAQLDERVDDVAHALGPARRLVLVSGSNDVDAIVGYLGALRGGHPVVLAPSGATQLDRIVDAFDPDVLMTAERGWTIDERRSVASHPLHTDLALLLSTSGSTGSPRLVRLSHDNLQANAAAIAEYLHLGPADRAITSLPMQYCYGLSVINSHLSAGASLVLTNGSVVDPCFWDLVREHGVTGLAGVPHTFDLLDRADFESMELPSLRYLTQAGGRLAPERVQRYAEQGHRAGWELYVMYGQTEATARMAYLPPALARTHPTAIGIPIPGGSLDLEPVEGASAEIGELVYRGPNVMLGYADGPDDLALGATVDALHTGDLARRAADGLFEIVGRRSRFAKVFGLRLDLDHLEHLLADRAIDAMCASDDERLVIGVTTPMDSVRALVQSETGLPANRVVVVPIGAVPRLANGKPDHPDLLRRASGAALVGPADEGERPPGVHPAVHRALIQVLGPVDVRGEATFVDLGGDSLSYVEMSVALEDLLGELPPSWHVIPLRELVPIPRPSRRLHQVETSVVLRAVSIVMVVGTHIGLFTVLGGAHLLLGVAGYNFARFRGQPGNRFRSIARIAVPSIVWLAMASTLNDRIHLPHLLLLNGWIGGDDAHGGYWYVEAIVQILIPLTVLLSVPAVRRLEHAHPTTVPVALLGAGLLIRFGVVDLPTIEPHDIRPHDIFWIFALGWVASEARTTTARLLVSATIVLAVPGYFGEPAREAFVVGGLLLLLWVPTVRLARPAVRVVATIASASLYIYLTHWQIFPPLRDHLGPVTALVGSILGGITAAWVAGALTHQIRRWRQSAPSGTSPDRSPAAVGAG